MSNRKKKKGGKGPAQQILYTALLLAAICVFVYSAYQLTMQLIPYYNGGKEYARVKKLAITVDDKNKNKAKAKGDEFRVDFAALMKLNPDTVGWIRFDEPSIISYPIVKSADNADYLTKTFTANDNKLGAIFEDMRSSPGFTDRNTFVYGHNLKVGGEMFSQLSDYAKEDFCKKHPYFYIYTPEGKLTYKVFSAATVKDTAENYNLSYPTDEDFMDYLQICKTSSNYKVDAELNAQSRIVSLSTCTNVKEDERFLLQGVLVDDK